MKKFSAEQERTMLDPAADPMDQVSALWNMRVDGIVRHKELVVSWLNSPEVHLRVEAMRTLLTWEAEHYLPLAYERLFTDSCRSIRGSIALDLQFVHLRFPVRKNEVARTLTRVVECDSHWRVVQQAYISVVFVLTGKAQPWIFDGFDRERDVNWELLAPYRSS